MTGGIHDNKIAVYMDEAEAELFKALLQADVLSTRRGQAVISFDDKGVLKQVEIKILAYKRSKKV